jgi:hypothetical protein
MVIEIPYNSHFELSPRGPCRTRAIVRRRLVGGMGVRLQPGMEAARRALVGRQGLLRGRREAASRSRSGVERLGVGAIALRRTF